MESKQRNVARNPNALSDAWDKRTRLVKQEQAAASAATDAKTIRLRALRLEKETQDAADKEAKKSQLVERKAKSVKRT